ISARKSSAAIQSQQHKLHARLAPLAWRGPCGLFIAPRQLKTSISTGVVYGPPRYSCHSISFDFVDRRRVVAAREYEIRLDVDDADVGDGRDLRGSSTESVDSRSGGARSGRAWRSGR